MPQPLVGLGTGPGIVADPAGNVWLCVLASLDNSVVRFASGSSKPELISVLSELGCQGIGCAGWQIDHAERHIIHMAFSQSGGRSRTAKVLYLLASSLLAGNADEAIIVVELEDDWRTSRPGGEVGLQTIWLPEDHSAAHRLQVDLVLEALAVEIRGDAVAALLREERVERVALQGAAPRQRPPTAPRRFK